MNRNKKARISPILSWISLWNQETLLVNGWQLKSLKELTSGEFKSALPERFFTLGIWIDSDEPSFLWIFSEGWLGAQGWNRENLVTTAEQFNGCFPGCQVLIQAWTRDDVPWFLWRRAGQRTFRWTCEKGDFLFTADPRAFRILRKNKFKFNQKALVFHRPREATASFKLIPRHSVFQNFSFDYRPDRFWVSSPAEVPRGLNLKGLTSQGPIGLRIIDQLGRAPSETTSRLLINWFSHAFGQGESLFDSKKWEVEVFDLPGAGVLEGTLFYQTLTWTMQIFLSPQTLLAWKKNLTGSPIMSGKDKASDSGVLWLEIQESLARLESVRLMTVPSPENGPLSLASILELLSGPDREKLMVNRLLPGRPLPGRYLTQALFWQEEILLEKRKVRKRLTEPQLPVAALGVILPRNTGLSLTPRPSQLGSKTEYQEAGLLVLEAIEVKSLNLSEPGNEILTKTLVLPLDRQRRAALAIAKDPGLEGQFYKLTPLGAENLLRRFTDRELAFIIGCWTGDRWRRYVSKTREKRIREEIARAQREENTQTDNPNEVKLAWVEFGVFLKDSI